MILAVSINLDRLTTVGGLLIVAFLFFGAISLTVSHLAHLFGVGPCSRCIKQSQTPYEAQQNCWDACK